MLRRLLLRALLTRTQATRAGQQHAKVRVADDTASM
jgi:hypothetical protein